MWLGVVLGSMHNGMNDFRPQDQEVLLESSSLAPTGASPEFTKEMSSN